MQLVIRADADARMGAGHMMRCLALAQAWQDAGGKATFLTACQLPNLNARISAEGVAVQPLTAEPGGEADADETWETANSIGAGWVVLDGYHFSGVYQARVRRDGVRVLVVDDYGHADHYAADLVLNQNLHARDELYPNREPYTRLLLGTRFALLRREFWKWRGWKRDVPEVARNVLVTLGGTDPDKVTFKVVEALQCLGPPGLDVLIVVGGDNPHLAELEKAATMSQGHIRLRANVADMPELMAWADVAVAAGGTTTWERALMGLPSLVMVLADNQKEVAEASDEAGIGWNLGSHGALGVLALMGALGRLLTDRPSRAEMARRGPRLIDGRGAARVAARMKAWGLRLRPAAREDCRLIWEWANEPATRAASFSSAPIPWDQHQQWFDAKLDDPGCVFFVAVDAEETPVGQVRFEIGGQEAVISVSLAERFHGLGYGPTVIRQAAHLMFMSHPVQQINAYIRPENAASCRAFEKVGFTPQETTVVRGNTARRLVLRRELA